MEDQEEATTLAYAATPQSSDVIDLPTSEHVSTDNAVSSAREISSTTRASDVVYTGREEEEWQWEWEWPKNWTAYEYESAPPIIQEVKSFPNGAEDTCLNVAYEKLKNVSIVTCLFLLILLALSFAAAAILTLISVLTTFLIKSVMYVCTLYAVIKQATSALW